MTTTASSTARWLVAIAAVLVLAGCAEDGSEASDPTDDGLRGVALDEPLDKPDMDLVDADGAGWNLREETDGYLTFVFFGYTSCPDICPVHMANLSSVFDRLPSPTTDRIKVVFVSTDPARDTPERMGEFMASFDSDFVGVTGDLPEITAGMRELGLAPPVHEEPDEDGFYEVGHPAQLLAFLPADDQAHYAYPWGMRQQDFVHDIGELLDRAAAQQEGS